MKDTIKKSVLFGLGLAVVTKDTVEKFVHGFVREGELTVKEGKSLVKDVLKESNKAQRHIRRLVDSSVKEVINKVPVATKNDLKELERRLRKK